MISFIGPGLPLRKAGQADEISHLLALPRVYGKDNLISEHLIEAAFFSALEFSCREHVNATTGEAFSCISYYSDDQRAAAMCSKESSGYVATMSAPFVRRLIKISYCLEPALEALSLLKQNFSIQNLRRRAQESVHKDHELTALLEGNAQVSEAEALKIVSQWPSVAGWAQASLGGYVIFYDMIRLVWVHEWAHALCGHIDFVNNELGISRLHEFSAERAGMRLNDEGVMGFRQNEIMQALEIHADEFAVKYCVSAILWGHDPIAGIAGPRIDLVDRLLYFNVACGVFTILWALVESRYSPDDTFFPPLQSASSTNGSQDFIITRSTHPPAALRYERFCEFQREIANRYETSTPLGVVAAGRSYLFLEILGKVSGYFFSLQEMAPGLMRTPTKKVLEAYSDHLVEVGAPLSARLEQLCYVPSSSPWSTEDHDLFDKESLKGAKRC